MQMKKSFTLMALAVLFMLPFTSQARVTEIQILTKESPTFSGTSFGTVGQYEKLTGIIKCEVDPKHPLNAAIVNIKKAQKNAKGLVEYDVDFVIYKPIDMHKGNGKILYDTPNRGGMITMGIFNNGTPGNGFLMKEGYTIVSNGWQAPYPIPGIMSFLVGLGSRLPAAAGSLQARLPIATNPDGSSIVARSREEYYDPPFNVPGPGDVFTKYLTYPAASLDKSKAVLTARAHEKAEKIVVPDWEYVDEYRFTFTKPSYADPGYIYEFIYAAKDPIVYGLGFASIRDVVSFLRYESKDDKGNPNPLRTPGSKHNTIKKALAYGMSQTGRVVKTFVYEGFNEAENGRIVFNGVNSHIGGSRRVWVNGQFSHPGDIFGNDQFPFTYKRTRDHFTGDFDSNLEKCEKSHTCPKIIHTDTESEIWSSGGSLVRTDTRGIHDIALPRNVRAYLFTGAKHGAGGSIAPGNCQQPSNPLDYRPLSRAILKALDLWVSRDIEPPETRYPHLSKKTFVPMDKLNFPKIPTYSYTVPAGTPPVPTLTDFPAVNYNGLYLEAYWIDYNGQPPLIMGKYPVYAMKVDKDGNGIDGVRLPDITVPIATYTGWNRTKDGFGGDNRLCTASGSFIPFAATKVERLTNGDPRLSLQERYPTHESYVKRVEFEAKKLVREKLLLEEDAQAIIDAAIAGTIGN